MKKFSTAILFAVAIAVLSWFLPWLYAVCTPSASNEPFLGFSPVSGQWVSILTVSGERPVITHLAPFAEYGDKGEPLTADQRDSLLPQMYYRQLSAHDRLPDSIAGQEASMHNLRSHEANFRVTPREINKVSSGIYLMMESMPVRVDLSDPEEAFRMTSEGIEFIRIATNEINHYRSRRFTKALKAKGFSFPGKDFSANITSRKQYDEGYLMVDSEGALFHVKQQAGRPFVARVLLPDSVRIKKAFIWEESDRDLLGYAIDADGRPYLLLTDGHRAVPFPAEAGTVDPEKESILIMSNLFNTVVRISSKDAGSRWMAFEPYTLKMLGKYTVPKEYSATGAVSKYIFPYVLSFVSTNDSLAYPRLTGFSAKALPLNCVLALVLLFPGMRRKVPLLKWGALLTVPFGIFSFIPFMILTDK